MIATKLTTDGHASAIAPHLVEATPVGNPNRRTAVLVGALFLLSTATFIVSNALITPLLASHDFLAAIGDHRQLMITATLIGLIDGVATVGIALVLYPILKR
jgi:Domain of unknown function (DUF4386)